MNVHIWFTNDNPFRKLEVLIMASVAELNAKIAELTDTIVAERAEVSDAIAVLDSRIVELTARIEAGATDLTPQIASVQLAIDEIKQIYNAPVPPVEPPVEPPFEPVA